jgi:hypothetical protein
MLAKQEDREKVEKKYLLSLAESVAPHTNVAT